MVDEHVISTLVEYVRQIRTQQKRLRAQLHEAENEVALLNQEIAILESKAIQTERAMETLDTGDPSLHTIANRRSIRIDDEYEIGSGASRVPAPRERFRGSTLGSPQPSGGQIAYISHHRSIPSIQSREALNQRFSDRTITQACTLLLGEAGGALHVNELYNLLIEGGFKFKGANPTISIAVSLNRNRRFRKVEPGTFDLVMRDASRAAS